MGSPLGMGGEDEVSLSIKDRVRPGDAGELRDCVKGDDKDQICHGGAGVKEYGDRQNDVGKGKDRIDENAYDGIEGLADDPKIVFIPSLFMFLTILALNLIGDRLRAFTDVKASNA